MGLKNRIILSFCVAIGMLFVSYWITNQRYILSGDAAWVRKIELFRGYFKPHNNLMKDSVLLINVSHDPVLLGIHGKNNKGLGYGKITDRKKLLQLLSELKRRNDYKYILLDILFSDSTDLRTEYDNSLYDLIQSMDRIVISKDSKEKLADERLNAKAGLVTFYTNIKFVSFAKYPYLVDGEKSLPLKMYEEITGRHIEHHALFSTDGGKLAMECIIPYFELRYNTGFYQEDEEGSVGSTNTWFNLGADLLGCSYQYGDSIETGSSYLYDEPNLTKGKYVVIGAFDGDDTHYTYMENQPGPIILFNAYLALLHGNHRIPCWGIFLMFCVYFYLAFRIFRRPSVSEENKAANNKLSISRLILANFAKSWVKYSFFLIVLSTITYLSWHVVYDIFITATIFDFIKSSVYFYYITKK